MQQHLVGSKMYAITVIASLFLAVENGVAIRAMVRHPAATQAFDPSSPLVAYTDQGTCGPRGDDAKADTSACKLGADVVRELPQTAFKVVATINGCNYFSFKVWACRESKVLTTKLINATNAVNSDQKTITEAPKAAAKVAPAAAKVAPAVRAKLPQAVQPPVAQLHSIPEEKTATQMVAAKVLPKAAAAVAAPAAKVAPTAAKVAPAAAKVAPAAAKVAPATNAQRPQAVQPPTVKLPSVPEMKTAKPAPALRAVPSVVAPSTSNAAALRAVKHDESEDKQQPAKGVSMQVEEKDIETLLAKLTPQCKEQFSAMINGHSAHWASWGKQSNSETSCASLNGKQCEIRASVTQAKALAQRSLQTTTDVTGPSCLPNQCIAGADLTHLANWHQKKVMEVRGVDSEVELHVDCSKHANGAVAVAGTSLKKDDPQDHGAAAAEEEKSHSHSEDDTHTHSDGETHSHSGGDEAHDHEAHDHEAHDHEAHDHEAHDEKPKSKSSARALASGVCLHLVALYHMFA